MDLTLVERDITDEDLAQVDQARVTVMGCLITLLPPCR
jgi:hypothetical protein